MARQVVKVSLGVWILCLFLAARKGCADGIFTVRTGPLTFPRDVHDPKFVLNLHPVLDEATEKQDFVPDQVVYMTSKEGEKYMCILPEEGEDGAPETPVQQGRPSTIRSSLTRKSPDDILEAYRKDGECYLRIQGWWIYELCYQKSVRQYHVERGQVVAEFYLGFFDKDATERLHNEAGEMMEQKDPRSQTASRKYHAHVYNNGTACDLKNLLRKTEVRYVCAEDDMGSIASVEETATCEYVIIFQTSLLCKHPGFHVEEQRSNVIDCHLVPKETPMKAPVAIVGEVETAGNSE